MITEVRNRVTTFTLSVIYICSITDIKPISLKNIDVGFANLVCTFAYLLDPGFVKKEILFLMGKRILTSKGNPNKKEANGTARSKQS